MIVQPVEGTLGSARVSPVGPAHVRPPIVGIAQVDRARGGAEYHGGGFQQLGFRPGIVGGVGGALGERHVSRRRHERRERRVGDRVSVQPEPIDPDTVGGALFRVVVVGSHEEHATGDPDHPRKRGVRRERERSGLAALGLRIDDRVVQPHASTFPLFPPRHPVASVAGTSPLRTQFPDPSALLSRLMKRRSGGTWRAIESGWDDSSTSGCNFLPPDDIMGEPGDFRVRLGIR